MVSRTNVDPCTCGHLRIHALSLLHDVVGTCTFLGFIGKGSVRPRKEHKKRRFVTVVGLCSVVALLRLYRQLAKRKLAHGPVCL